MKRSRGGEEEGQNEEKKKIEHTISVLAVAIKDAKNTEDITKPVFIVHILEDDFITYRAELTQEEIDLIAPRFVRTGPIDRQEEVTQNGPAAAVLKKIMKYKIDGDDGILYESSGWVSVSSDVIAETPANTIVWFGYQ